MADGGSGIWRDMVFPEKLEQSVRVRLVDLSYLLFTPAGLDSEALRRSGCSNLPVV